MVTSEALSAWRTGLAGYRPKCLIKCWLEDHPQRRLADYVCAKLTCSCPRPTHTRVATRRTSQQVFVPTAWYLTASRLHQSYWQHPGWSAGLHLRTTVDSYKLNSGVHSSTYLTATERHLPYRITQRYLPTGTGESTPPQRQPVLDLPTPQGWTTELTRVAGYVPRWFTCPQTVTHPISNRAQCRATSFIKNTTTSDVILQTFQCS